MPNPSTVVSWITSLTLVFSSAAFAGGFIQMKGKKTVLKDAPKSQPALKSNVEDPPTSNSKQLGSYVPSKTETEAAPAAPAEKGIFQRMAEQIKTLQDKKEEQKKTIQEIEKEL